MHSPIAFIHRLGTFKILEHLLKEAQLSSDRDSSFTPISGRLLYVSQSCRPYDINGYTARTHELLKALHKEGYDIHVLTRTGYPWDRHKTIRPVHVPLQQAFAGDLSLASTSEDGITYHHLPSPKNNCFTAIYAARASSTIERFCRVLQPAVLHAASNHVNALPVLIAARRLGIPFQYEIRGLWELSRLAKNSGYKNSHNFQLGLDLEGFVARHADRVFVISQELARYAVQNWKIPEDKLALLPNCVDGKRFVPQSFSVPVSADPSRIEDASSSPASASQSTCIPTVSSPSRQAGKFSNETSIFTIGYAGSLLEYEGLDVLLQALHLLQASRESTPSSPQLPLLRLEFVGDGDTRAKLEALTQSLHLEQMVTFLGRVSPEEARKRLNSWSLVCLPRKAYEVCTLIPPLKLVEAMAMAKPVLVPDLPLFHEETGEHGLFFEAGNPRSLARLLRSVLVKSADLPELGAKNRVSVLQHRQWSQFVPELMKHACASSYARPGN